MEERENCRISRKTGHEKSRGYLKIFFSYAEGTGKTYSMLEAAHEAKKRGTDVLVGYVDAHESPETEQLLKGLEQLPKLRDGERTEFDLDAAIARSPQLLLVDDLAHGNGENCRHKKRYQDVRELLMAGINVYTTVNVQDIESLNDMVTAIMGEQEKERIPDSVFDDADQVEMVDLEPEELLERLHMGNLSGEEEIPLTVEKLTALREIALRRCADRVNHLAETEGIKGNSDYYTDEHILVCISPSPSNGKTIRMAARMAGAFRGTFTALFVETSEIASLGEEDRERLRSNIHLAQQLGASIETVYGEDIPFQIAEFARLSGVSKIVLGRSKAARKYLFGKPALAEQIILNAPGVDIYVIPDHEYSSTYRRKTKEHGLIFSLKDIFKCIGILVAASLLGFLFQRLGFAEANIITIYVLAVLVISIVTVHRIYSLIASVVSVLVFNFLFTVPKFSLRAYDQGYPVTFLIMFIAAFLTGTLATKLKSTAKQSAKSAFRTKVLFDTNQLLQQAANREEIVSAAANQLIKLLNKDIIVYLEENGRLKEPVVFLAGENTMREELTSPKERAAAAWAYKNNRHAGATTQTLSNAKCLYLAIRVNQAVYGVVGIAVEDQPIDAFENSILLSILGECSLALENEKNAKEKEEAAILAKNEQLRANLLRAISHDLRTPLTSISGNASNLLSNGDSFDEETKKSLYQDIYDDSMWLINLVENLLSVTRLEEGRLNLHISAELVDDVVTEALRHVSRLRCEHRLTVKNEEEFLLAKMDAKLIVQVLINLIDNAIKYTPKGSEITVFTKREGKWAVISISDNGPGIPDENKPKVFEMFYSGANGIADSRRSLGLGLSLCKSIVNAHGGSITVSDQKPHGAVFTFTLPIEEVELHE